MMQAICDSAPDPEAGRPRPCPLQAALAARPCVDSYDQFSRVALSLFRFIGAAYATGASDCWEAAYRFADEAPGIADSPLLVARAAALVRILRSGRPCELCFMPPSCRRLSQDEVELMRLLAIARSKQPGELESVVSQFVGNENEIATTRAVNALAVC
ncbi:hypothetical protein A5906_10105 [Bradyrhizobium sacchari]|uniref:Uncharacterized protein n=1 Tax=Bradyrhizobium sacchari TaxID=1399419 RepID=A0A560JBY7_9BRAD|nr:hypothetical protein [Bradyrhizobium sacchari]OPY95008.1 hypothetical protein A5906_10105 [Bradyrhizobium sacchari]TWB49855.1 hypothetical protein FBZ94_112169 [Bradyrhizobium sacchari]TWB68487.1 hypothetical protein FBZ95_11144 [Bradyrhizobium sacchari]